VSFTATATTTEVNSFKITVPTSGTAGTAFNITVTAYGKDGKVLTTYTGPVKLTSTGPLATLPTDNSSGWQNGVKTFSVTLKTAGSQKITVEEGNISATSSTISIKAATAYSLRISSGNNQTGIAGQQLMDSIIVWVSDTHGNPVSGKTVSLAFSTVPAGAKNHTLSSKSRTTDSQGQASINVTLGSETGTYRVKATATGLVGSPLEFTATAVDGTLGGFKIETPPGATVGVPTAFTVTALTKSGHVSRVGKWRVAGSLGQFGR
jgi:hypothetical protein